MNDQTAKRLLVELGWMRKSMSKTGEKLDNIAVQLARIANIMEAVYTTQETPLMLVKPENVPESLQQEE